jgi:hypothetical protein
VLALGSGAVLDAGIQSLLQGLPDRGGQGERGAGAPRARRLPGGSGGMESPRGSAEPSPRASTVVYLSADFGTVARRTGLDRYNGLFSFVSVATRAAACGPCWTSASPSTSGSPPSRCPPTTWTRTR